VDEVQLEVQLQQHAAADSDDNDADKHPSVCVSEQPAAAAAAGLHSVLCAAGTYIWQQCPAQDGQCDGKNALVLNLDVQHQSAVGIRLSMLNRTLSGH
jgi:hypothetical protein